MFKMDCPKASEPDLTTSGHVFPFQEGKVRGRAEDQAEVIEQVKRARLLGLDPVIETGEGIRTARLQITKERKIESLVHQNEKEEDSKIAEATDMMIFEKPVQMPMNHNLLTSDVTVPEHVMEKTSNKTDLVVFDVDLNDPIYPYKKLGQVQTADPSECGSATGQKEIDESMKKWSELKQNGFVSDFHKKTYISRVRKYQPTKKCDEWLKKKIDSTKQVLSNIHTNDSSPKHLLSGLNPGIIKHVRNSNQVNSIIKAMLQNEMPQKQESHMSISELKRGSMEVINGTKEHCCASLAGHPGLSLRKPFSPCFSKKEQSHGPDTSKNIQNNESCNTSNFSAKCNDYAHNLKLSSFVTMAPEHSGKTTNADFSTIQEDITSLSIKAACVALQWLELIQSDLKGRLACIKRNKKRVKNALLKTLPCLFSEDLDPKQNNECSRKESLNKHLVRWKALFIQMEVSLIKEKNELESWLCQVEKLRFQCQEGLRYVNENGFSQLETVKDLRIFKSQEACEKEFAVRAAAASLYSISNLIMTT